ncbi:hypothetical protein DM02DRAFT_543709, partial [Periconia macrospinosa]
YDEAHDVHQQALKVNKGMLGDNYPSMLTSMASLASTYCNQGRWAEAEALEVQVMEISMTTLGDSHPNTLTSMKNLAFTWKSLGCDAEV